VDHDLVLTQAERRPVARPRPESRLGRVVGQKRRSQFEVGFDQAALVVPGNHRRGQATRQLRVRATCFDERDGQPPFETSQLGQNDAGEQGRGRAAGRRESAIAGNLIHSDD
jgi:hypothetical protein